MIDTIESLTGYQPTPTAYQLDKPILWSDCVTTVQYNLQTSHFIITLNVFWWLRTVCGRRLFWLGSLGPGSGSVEDRAACLYYTDFRNLEGSTSLCLCARDPCHNYGHKHLRQSLFYLGYLPAKLVRLASQPARQSPNHIRRPKHLREFDMSDWDQVVTAITNWFSKFVCQFTKRESLYLCS